MPSSIAQQMSSEYPVRRGKCKLVHSRATLRSVAEVHGRAVVVQSSLDESVPPDVVFDRVVVSEICGLWTLTLVS